MRVSRHKTLVIDGREYTTQYHLCKAEGCSSQIHDPTREYCVDCIEGEKKGRDTVMPDQEVLDDFTLEMLRSESEYLVETDDPQYAKIAKAVLQLLDEIGRLKKLVGEK